MYSYLPSVASYVPVWYCQETCEWVVLPRSCGMRLCGNPGPNCYEMSHDGALTPGKDASTWPPLSRSIRFFQPQGLLMLGMEDSRSPLTQLFFQDGKSSWSLVLLKVLVIGQVWWVLDMSLSDLPFLESKDKTSKVSPFLRTFLIDRIFTSNEKWLLSEPLID